MKESIYVLGALGKVAPTNMLLVGQIKKIRFGLLHQKTMILFTVPPSTQKHLKNNPLRKLSVTLKKVVSIKFGSSFNNFARTFVWQHLFPLAVLLPSVAARLEQNSKKESILSYKFPSKAVEELSKSVFSFCNECRTTFLFVFKCGYYGLLSYSLELKRGHITKQQQKINLKLRTYVREVLCGVGHGVAVSVTE